MDKESLRKDLIIKAQEKIEEMVDRLTDAQLKVVHDHDCYISVKLSCTITD